MSIIRVLDDSTINKIAAGEVVERPASVIKELVENSMDAGASQVEVEIMAGGTGFMRVTDNGKGMSTEDARLAILRHATSKIREVGDLSRISTMGFRGEALPTIASVSRFTMLTRQEGSELGTRVDIQGGKEPEVRETGCNIGTTVKVEDLFFNTPARKKFLKTNHTEGGKISDFIVKLALSRPDIAFRFVNNNKLALVTPGNGSLYDALRSIYGGTVAEALLELKLEDEEIGITGYITKPSMLKSSRGWQTYMVNGRVIQNRAIAKAVDNAYRSLIPKSGFPMAVLSIRVPQRTVDVNVHPQKTEMKFEDESRIFKAVYKSVLDAIRPATPSLQQVAAPVERAERHYTMEPMRFVPASAPAPASEPGTSASSSPAAASPPRTPYEAVRGNSSVSFREAQELLRSEVSPEPSKPGEDSSYEAYDIRRGTPAGEGVREEEAFSLEGNMVPIGQVDKCYIIAQDLKGLYIVDQHAAHERILFDKLSAMSEGIPSQQLLVHLLLSFDPGEAELIEEHRELFGSLGFSLEPSGPAEFRLTEIPADIPMGEAEEVIREILVNLRDMHRVTARDIRQQVLATTACRAAIKAGDELNLRQMQIVLEELSATAYPYTCPHGRPTILKFSSDELAKMFKRTGF